MKKFVIACTLVLLSSFLAAENGYDCWLRYPLIPEGALLRSYRQSIRALQFKGGFPNNAGGEERNFKGIERDAGQHDPGQG
jgi:alpha-glucuronidase